MGGHIPGLSRGGSWVPPAHPGHPANGTIANPHPREAISASVYSTASAGSYGTGLPLSPMSYNPIFPYPLTSPFLPSPATSRYSAPPMPLQASGWPIGPSSIMSPSKIQTTSFEQEQTPFPVHSQAASIIPLPPRTPTVIPSLPPPPSPSIQARYVNVRTHEPSEPSEPSWEYAAGAPKRIDREQPYHASQRPNNEHKHTAHLVYRKRADSLPRPPPPEVAQHTDPSEQISLEATFEERDRTASGSGKQLEARRNSFKRPSKTRSSSHYDALATRELLPGKLDRNHAHDHVKRSPPRLHTLARLPRDASSPSSSHANSRTEPATHSPSPYIKLGRPPNTRRHTSHTDRADSDNPTYPEKGERARHVSSPDRSPSHRQIVVSSPSLPNKAKSKAYDMSPLSTALPCSGTTLDFQTHTRVRPASPSARAYMHTHSHSQSTPDSPEEVYDRYSTHPAAPVPDRADRYVYSPSAGSSKSRAPVSPSPTDMILVGDAYLPVGYARPVKELEWNRDGPAMKTYGVAWKRHTEDLVLPKGPEGPRWVQARPPRVDVLSGGGWWESGGQGV